jgi:hypothetical protein
MHRPLRLALALFLVAAPLEAQRGAPLRRLPVLANPGARARSADELVAQLRRLPAANLARAAAEAPGAPFSAGGTSAGTAFTVGFGASGVSPYLSTALGGTPLNLSAELRGADVVSGPPGLSYLLVQQGGDPHPGGFDLIVTGLQPGWYVVAFDLVTGSSPSPVEITRWGSSAAGDITLASCSGADLAATADAQQHRSSCMAVVHITTVNPGVEGFTLQFTGGSGLMRPLSATLAHMGP